MVSIAAVLIPNFALRAASPGGLPDAPAALSAGPGARVLDELNEAAEASGVAAGMSTSEALARCAELRIVPADPVRAGELWESILGSLEGVGAAVESDRVGEAFFAVDGLRDLYGGDEEVLAAARAALPSAAFIAAAPSRLAALMAARRHDRSLVASDQLTRFLAPHPVAVLRKRLGASDADEQKLISALLRLGITTLGKLAQLSADQVADRFGPIGLRALRLCRGDEEPLRPRAPYADLEVSLELHEGCAGPQLERALDLLVGRLLAKPERRARTFITVRLSANLVGGGSWSVEQGLGRPTASTSAIRAPLGLRLANLPSPASSLQLRVLAFGPPQAAQLEIATEGTPPRKARVAAALREVRAAAGPDAVTRLVDVELESRIPERRFVLLPYENR
jgi:protein ImuB